MKNKKSDNNPSEVIELPKSTESPLEPASPQFWANSEWKVVKVLNTSFVALKLTILTVFFSESMFLTVK